MQQFLSRRPLSILLTSIGIIAGLAGPSAAQISRLSATAAATTGSNQGNDVAFDPINRVYLVVGAQGVTQGAFVNEAGVPVSGSFLISNPAQYAQYPRVIYSPDVNGTGGFLVVWHSAGELPTGMNQVHARTVSYGANPVLGVDTVAGFSPPSGSKWTAGPAGAYSTTSHKFLITWQTVSWEVDGVILNASGQPTTGVFAISVPGNGGRDPGVAWNPNTDQFGVGFTGWDTSSRATASFALVRPSDGAVLKRTVVEYAAGTFISDLTFNSSTGNFVMAWVTTTSRAAEINANGDVIGIGLTASAVGTYDGLSLSYNPVSGTILMAGEYTYEIGGVELSGHGAKIGAEQEITAAATLFAALHGKLAFPGSDHPRVTANPLSKTWGVSFSLGFAEAAAQVVATGGVVAPPPPADSDGDGVPDTVDQCPTVFAQTANGCPGPPPPPPPPPSDTDGDGVTDNLDACPLIYAQSANGCPVSAPMNGNFSGQGDSQVVFVNKSNGSAYLWTLNNGVYTGGGYLYQPTADPGWTVVGTSDLTGDGLSDILWQNQQTGAVRLFRMAYYSKIGEQTAGLQVADPNWRIAATGDFNNDGQADIVWQHLVTGNVVIWFMKGVNGVAQFQSSAYVTFNGNAVALGSDPWKIVGTADFNADGYRDVAFQNTATGEMTIWALGPRNQAGVPIVGQASLGSVNPDWQIKSIANYAGDGNADALFQSASTGQLYLWIRSGGGFVPYGFLNSPASIWMAAGPR